MTRKLLLLNLLLLASYLVLGQNCQHFHRSPGCKVKNNQDFKIFGQSKSSVVDAGKTYKYQVVLFGGYDYKVGLCTERGFDPIHIRIINAETEEMLYDNADDEYTETVGFSNEITKNVILEITVMATDMEFRDVGDSRVCLGIAIFWRNIPNMGLEKENGNDFDVKNEK